MSNTPALNTEGRLGEIAKSQGENNFNGADLSGMDLRGRAFQSAYMSDANLSGADLSFIIYDVHQLITVFRGVDLRNADFSGANLDKVDFSDADLTGAKLLDVSLRGTIYNENTQWPRGFDPKTRIRGLFD